MRRLGPVSCFAQNDLYTTRWGAVEDTEIERFFFGGLDKTGAAAVDYFAGFDEHKHIEEDALNDFLRYMSVQKLRTPKGLAWLQRLTRSLSHNFTLMELQRLQQISARRGRTAFGRSRTPAIRPQSSSSLTTR